MKKEPVKKVLVTIILLFICFLVPTKFVSASDGWGDFGSNIQWYFHEHTGVLEISGTGSMPDTNIPPWENYHSSIKKVVIQDGVTSISNSAFAGYSNLTSAELPASLRSIGAWAFEQSGLKKIHLPEGLLEIGNSAFVFCKDLSNIKIPGTVNRVSSSAFMHCENLKNIVISPGVQILENSCFCDTGITQISIPSSVTTMGSNVFHSCRNLKTANIPSTVTSMDYGVFSFCDNLKYVYFNAKGMMPANTFQASGVEVVKIGEATTGIGQVALSWTNLKAIYIPQNVVEFHASSIEPNADEVKLYGYPGSAAWKYAGLKNYISFIDVSTNSGLSSWNNIWDSISKISLNSGNTQVSLSHYTYNYNGKTHTPSVTVKYKGKTLKNKVDYTLSFSTGRKNVGKYSVKINFKGKYKGSISKTFKIIPAPTTITKLQSPKSGWLTIQYRANRAADGYQLQYGSNSSMKNAKSITISNKATLSYIVKNAKRNTTYYVRVRTFKKVNKEYLFSAWSSKKKMKVK